MVEKVNTVLLWRNGDDFDIAFIHLLGLTGRLLAGWIDLATSVITRHLIALKLHGDSLRQILIWVSCDRLVLANAIEGRLNLLNIINCVFVNDIGRRLEADESFAYIPVWGGGSERLLAKVLLWRHIIHSRSLVHLSNEIAQVLIIMVLQWLVHSDRLALEVHLNNFIYSGRLRDKWLCWCFPSLGHLRLGLCAK